MTLADSDVVWVLQPTRDGEYMTVETARGVNHSALKGTRLSTRGSLSSSVLESRQPRLIDDSAGYELLLGDGRLLGPVMAVPLISAGIATGVMLVGRLQGALRFTRSDLEMAADFAGQASVAMELGAARVDRERMALLEDRGRIARDLHDRVIQQLFATGLELQSIAGSTTPALARRIADSVSNMDASISQIRTVIFALSTRSTDQHDTVRHRIITLANELAPRLARTPNVSFSGPVDLVIANELADEVVAVTREALLNVIKHAAAEHATIELVATTAEVRLLVTDDGGGSSGSTRRSGISNLEQRAVLRGGRFYFESDSGGTRLSWIVPTVPVEVGA